MVEGHPAMLCVLGHNSTLQEVCRREREQPQKTGSRLPFGLDAFLPKPKPKAKPNSGKKVDATPFAPSIVKNFFNNKKQGGEDKMPRPSSLSSKMPSSSSKSEPVFLFKKKAVFPELVNPYAFQIPSASRSFPLPMFYYVLVVAEFPSTMFDLEAPNGVPGSRIGFWIGTITSFPLKNL